MKRFFEELPKNFREMGQISPSSRALARKLTRPVRELKAPKRILEVGPGTGSITREILRLLSAGDSLVVCEINTRLLEGLRSDLMHEPEFRPLLRHVEFQNVPVQELRERVEERSFDVIVSSLPFTNFSPAMVQEVLDLYEWLLRPGGQLSFYEYLGLRRVGQVFRSEKERKRVRAIADIISHWREERERDGMLRTSVTFLNLPPARALVAKY